MKTKIFLLLALALAVSIRIASAADPLTEAFQKGLLEEEANRNLDAAIQAYQSVLKQLDEQRKLAATTIFRLGECYRKLGKTNEATAQYQRVLREFPDQEVLAKLSQQNLTALGVGGESKPKKPELLSVPLVDDETAEIERLRKMIKDSPDLINAPNQQGDGRTPLEKAAEKGQTSVVRFLLEKRADPNTGALQLAAQLGHRRIVELLVSHGANVNMLDPQGWAALHKATGQGYRAVAEALIAAKADVNVKTADGTTPLHFAVSGRNQGLAELLLTNGADANAKTSSGQTPLHRAATQKHGPITELLLKNHADVNAADQDGRTPLYLAVENSAIQVCEILLKNGADVNAKIISFILRAATRPAMLGAATRPAMLGNSARGESVECNGFTALHLAALIGNEPLVKLLLEYKADANARASQERSPLYLAVTYATPPVVKVLLENGADVNAGASESSDSPLITAVKRQSQEMVSIMLAHKPNLERRDEQGLSALQIAGSHRLERIMELLLDAGADPNVAYGPDGATPLHWAVLNKNRRMVEALLKHKANPNAAESSGRTPLDIAKSLAPQSSAQGQRVLQTIPGSRSGTGSSSNEIVSDIIQLLRKAGATEYPQRPNSIMIGRGDVFSVVFSKDSREENRYTLMEAIGMRFRNYVSPTGTPTAFTSELSFPDFSQVRIHRNKGANGTGDEEITVNLDKPLQTGDCSKDMLLRWGDLVEIPERAHKLNELWLGLPFEVLEPLRRCTQRSVKILVKAKSGPIVELHQMLDLFPKTSSDPRPIIFGEATSFNVQSFRIDEVLHAANILLTSSDLTRVKVKRTDPDTKQTKGITVNRFDPAQILWLRDGDVIEVPEKE